MPKNIINKINQIFLNLKNGDTDFLGLLIIFFISALFIISRRVDMITYPQFWAEDGTAWFEDAYNFGFVNATLQSHTGYMQTFSRLTGGLTMLFPMQYAPLIFNIIAICIKALPVMLLFSKRFHSKISNLWCKIGLTIAYIAAPNIDEAYLNVTNSHWYLAIAAFMLIITPKINNKTIQIADSIVLLITGLSGPFVFPLSIIFLIKYFYYKEKNLSHLVALGIGLIVQSISLLYNFSSRINIDLGASFFAFIKVITGQIFIAGIIGKNGFRFIYNNFLQTNNGLDKFFYITIFFIGVTVVWITIKKGSSALKLFLLFAGLILAASLYSPMASTKIPQWQIMASPGAATRYWVIPIIAYLISIIFIFTIKNAYTKIFSSILLCILIISIVNNWKYNAWQNLHFVNYAQKFSTVPIDAVFEIPSQPLNWHKIRLIKH